MDAVPVKIPKVVNVGPIQIGGRNPLILIAGPCVLEEETTVLRIAENIREISDRLNIPWIFKSSYLKDNRSSAYSYQGPGLEKGLMLLNKVRDEFNVPLLSDIHDSHDAEACAEVLDIIQIPAYLSMQTSLTLAVGKTGKVVNVKKGQFLHPHDMRNIIGKLESVGNNSILLTERGSCFGYRNLVADMRSLPLMRELGYPVIFDPTHTLRNYGLSSSDPRGGNPELIPYISRAGVAAGCDGVFIETHDDLKNARCDAASMLPLEYLEELLKDLIAIDQIVKNKEKMSESIELVQ